MPISLAPFRASGAVGLLRHLRNRRVQAALAQLCGAACLLTLLLVLGATLARNLAQLNAMPDLAILLRPAGMRIGESVLPFEPTDSFLWAMLAGAANTVRVSVLAIAFATVVGTAVGVMRLSGNPLLRGLTSAYVELFRNTPLLLQILFWSAILLKLPRIKDALSLGDVVFLSQRGLQVPALVLHGGWVTLCLASLAGCLGLAATVAVSRSWGVAGRTVSGLAAFAALSMAALALQGAIGVECPSRRAFGFVGGMALTPEYCALLIGLVAYAGAFIAEIVRGGILTVPAGQWEGARSLGLHDLAIMRLVVLPQALHVVLPPLTSQYVSIIKNSSLAIAIGFPDLFWAVSSTINITGHAVEGIVALITFYLGLTLGTSSLMGLWYGRILRRGAP